MKTRKSDYIITAILAVFFLAATIGFHGCANSSGTVHVKHHSNIGYSDTWEITDGVNKVFYYNGDCCCVAGMVVDQVANLIQIGWVEWPRLATDKEYQKIIMDRSCKENK